MPSNKPHAQGMTEAKARKGQAGGLRLGERASPAASENFDSDLGSALHLSESSLMSWMYLLQTPESGFVLYPL